MISVPQNALKKKKTTKNTDYTCTNHLIQAVKTQVLQRMFYGSVVTKNAKKRWFRRSSTYHLNLLDQAKQ